MAMQPQVINTLRALIRNDYSLTAHCNEDACRHTSKLDLPKLADRLGLDFVAIGDPNPLVARLRCAKCGKKNLSLILSPMTGYEQAQFRS